MKLYIDHNMLWVKHATHQKAESLRSVFLSNLDNTVNNKSIFNTKYTGFSSKQQLLLHFHNLTFVYNHPYNLPKNPFLYFSQFLVSYSQLLVNKIILTIPFNTPFFYISVILHLLIFVYNLPKILGQKYFPTLATEPIQAASRDQGARKPCEN